MTAKLTWKAHRRALPLDLIEELEQTLPPETFRRMMRNLGDELPTIVQEIDDPFERFFDTETLLAIGPFLKARKKLSPATAKTYGYLLTHFSDYMRTQGFSDPGEIEIEHLVNLFETDLLSYSLRADGSVFEVRPGTCHPDKKKHKGACDPSDPEKNCGWSGSQRHGMLCALRAYLRWAKVPETHPIITMTAPDRERLGIDAKSRKRKPETKGGSARWLKFDIFRKLVEIAKDYGHKDLRKRNVAILETLWYSGARASELCDIKVEFIDWEYDEDIWAAPIIAKGGEEQELLILDGAHDAIGRWLIDRQKRFGLSPVSGPLFVNRDGQALTRDAIQTIQRKMGAQLGKKVSPHDYRRGALRYMRETLGVSYEDLQAFSRHKNVATLEGYLEGADRKPAARRLAAAYKTNGNKT